MPTFYNRYQQGFYQEVYDELLAMGEQVFEPPIYEDALLVAKEIMRRVRKNIELIVPRLQFLGYHFGEGFMGEISDEERALIEQDVPIYKPPTPDASERVDELEQLVGRLPLALRCWYEEVGGVNLIGLFPSSDPRVRGRDYWECFRSVVCLFD